LTETEIFLDDQNMTLIELLTSPGRYRVTFVSALAGVVGLGLLIACISIVISDYHYFSAATSTNAEVITFSHQAGSSRSASVTEASIIFQTPNGQFIRTSVRDVGETDISAIGQTIRIRYLPEDPFRPKTEAALKGFWSLFVLGNGSLFFFLFGYLAGKEPVARPGEQVVPK
jgi:peptidoglycan/LPS O-acetylase OafA/YrhL